MCGTMVANQHGRTGEDWTLSSVRPFRFRRLGCVSHHVIENATINGDIIYEHKQEVPKKVSRVCCTHPLF